MKNKKVLITGAGTGIGLSCVEKFLEKDWIVYAHYNKSSGELDKLKKERSEERIILKKCDFSNREDFDCFLNYVKKLKINALINNAGIYDFSYDKENRIDEVQEVLLVNTIVPTLLAEVVLNNMKQKKQGSILNISSIGSKYGSGIKNIFYGISKSALEASTKSLAREGASYNILVNAIRPGVTDTSFHVKAGKNLAKRIDMIPLKRMANPSEIADLVYYLCAENTFITNEIITIAGGE